MSTEYREKYKCPECDSETIRFKFKVNNKDKTSAYANVNEEIQCGNCFMDIPANVFIINKDSNLIENKKIWNSFYKPEHIKKAAQCSKCNLHYWDIEKKLSIKNIISSDIFYQTFDSKIGSGKMICRLCDPKAFESNKQ